MLLLFRQERKIKNPLKLAIDLFLNFYLNFYIKINKIWYLIDGFL